MKKLQIVRRSEGKYRIRLLPPPDGNAEPGVEVRYGMRTVCPSTFDKSLPDPLWAQSKFKAVMYWAPAIVRQGPAASSEVQIFPLSKREYREVVAKFLGERVLPLSAYLFGAPDLETLVDPEYPDGCDVTDPEAGLDLILTYQGRGKERRAKLEWSRPCPLFSKRQAALRSTVIEASQAVDVLAHVPFDLEAYEQDCASEDVVLGPFERDRLREWGGSAGTKAQGRLGVRPRKRERLKKQEDIDMLWNWKPKSPKGTILSAYTDEPRYRVPHYRRQRGVAGIRRKPFAHGLLYLIWCVLFWGTGLHFLIAEALQAPLAIRLFGKVELGPNPWGLVRVALTNQWTEQKLPLYTTERPLPPPAAPEKISGPSSRVSFMAGSSGGR